MSEKVYLGDSVYAEFDTVMGGDITLTTENGRGPSNIIYLEPKTLENLNLLRQQAAIRAAHLRCLEDEQ